MSLSSTENEGSLLRATFLFVVVRERPLVAVVVITAAGGSEEK